MQTHQRCHNGVVYDLYLRVRFVISLLLYSACLSLYMMRSVIVINNKRMYDEDDKLNTTCTAIKSIFLTTEILNTCLCSLKWENYGDFALDSTFS